MTQGAGQGAEPGTAESWRPEAAFERAAGYEHALGQGYEHEPAGPGFEHGTTAPE
ncbi:hypothetical protein ITX34_01910, partial [Streptomyces bryophytorum]|nr:hypothetical protein [Actinacidiphila bryophytorum]